MYPNISCVQKSNDSENYFLGYRVQSWRTDEQGFYYVFTYPKFRWWTEIISIYTFDTYFSFFNDPNVM